ncbi:helix-turn-helix domain-containing protein [Ascidiimonas sp. W6]|uniref:helix-turn-helix domain-containing protein n=1 Tax=Ascidiimonas meishanensis TaxID=3128903 RepID=UPI0030EB5A49
MAEEIELNDDSVENYIASLAISLKTDYQTENNIYRIQIPAAHGSGYISGVQFDNGLAVIDHDFLLKKEWVLPVKSALSHPLKLMFNREHSFYHKFEKEDEFSEIKHLENAIIASTPENNHVLRIPAEHPICFFSIEINRKLFESKVISFLPEMNKKLRGMFRDVNGVKTLKHTSYYSLEIAKFIKEFTECELDHFMKAVYQEGKAYEIISHQFKQFLDDQNNPDRRKILRQVTIRSIEDAVEIIQEEIESMESIAKLAKRVGINQNTLQNGFKQLYKTSVNEYIRNYRIEKAKELLENSTLNITQITYKIGINSRSYFSKLFKEKYGISPKTYLEQSRGNKTSNQSA